MGKRRQPAKRKQSRGVTQARIPRQPDDFGAFLRTGGMRPEKQLALVLRFLDEKLDETNAAEWSSQLKGLPLRPLESESGRLRIRWQLTGSYEALSVAALKKLQDHLRGAIRSIVAPEQGDRWRHIWPLPRPEGLAMLREQDGTWIWLYSHTDSRKSDDGSVTSIVLATAQLFAEHSDRVRTCAWCTKIFVAVKRQEYCTPQHAQLARDQKKKTARNGGGTKEGA